MTPRSEPRGEAALCIGARWRALTLALLCLAVAAPAAAEDKKPAAAPAAPAAPKPPQADTDQALNAIGLSIAKSLEQFSLTPAEMDKVVAGMREGLSGKPRQKLDEKAQENLSAFVKARMAAAADREKTRGAAYLASAAKEKGAIKTASGAVVVPIKEGTGASPSATDTVKAHYAGTFVDGKPFDASRDHGTEPAQFSLGGGVIPCWTEALQKMKVGGRARIVCPPAAAYGEQGRPPVIPGNATLVFDVELLDVVKTPPPAATQQPAQSK